MQQKAMHDLGFRVMRLSKTPLQPPARIFEDLDNDFETDILGSLLQQKPSTSSKKSEYPILRSPLEPCQLAGWLELPTSFGSLYLGEAFQSCISIYNMSKTTTAAVHCKVELETARGRVSLHDNAASKFDLPPNGRHDVIIRHDVKEVGQHTLVCSVTYTAGDGERRYLPQHFKFTSSNPLSVRTKSRVVHRSILLEACIENTSRAALVLDTVRFEPAPQVSVQQISPSSRGSLPATSVLAEYMDNLQIISPSGGALNLLYKLEISRESGVGSAGSADGATLGKLDIRWRTPLGDLGRLQTQPIVALAAAAKEVVLQVVDAPVVAKIEAPFQVTFQVCNNSDRRLRDLTVRCQEDSAAAARVLPLGSDTLDIKDLAGLGSVTLNLGFLALERGIHRLPEISLHASGSQTVLDTLNLSIRVH